MISRSSQSIGRLFQSRLPPLAAPRSELFATHIERTSASAGIIIARLKHGDSPGLRCLTRVDRRTYVDGAVSRPKAHTGKTASAPRKKAVPGAEETLVAKSIDPKAMPNTKAPIAVEGKPPKGKDERAKKISKEEKEMAKITEKKEKLKAIINAKKEKEKAIIAAKKEKEKARKKSKYLKDERSKIKKLKATALETPKQLPASTWNVMKMEIMRELSRSKVPFRTQIETASSRFKNLSPEQREHYHHIAEQNKAANAIAYRKWIESYTPEEIRKANLAREQLKQQMVRTRPKPHLKDERQVKRHMNPYFAFHNHRLKSNENQGLPSIDVAKASGKAWKALSAAERQEWVDRSEQDRERYVQETKTVYDRDIPRPKGSNSVANKTNPGDDRGVSEG